MSRRALFVLMMGFALAVRLPGALHSVDGWSKSAWRECDVAGIARAFGRESWNPLLPQIEWRGFGPGYVEMEFPFIPYSAGLAYRAVGERPMIARFISLGIAAAGLAAFWRIALLLLPLSGAVAAFVLFAVSPLPVQLATSLQPDGAMIAFTMIAMYSFLRWVRAPSWPWYIAVMTTTAVAILAKGPAIHIGIAYGILILARRQRLSFLAVAGLAAGILIPVALWYLHARSLWLEYGNSLGVSNHHHLASWNKLADKNTWLSILQIDLRYAWSPIVVAVIALAAGLRLRLQGLRVILPWLAAVAISYVIFAGTSSEEWADYYHIVVVPPVCLLFGSVAASARREWRRGSPGSRDAAFLFALAGCFGAAALFIPRAVTLLSAGVVAVALASVMPFRRTILAPGSHGRAAATAILAALCLAAPVKLLANTIDMLRYQPDKGWYDCATLFASRASLAGQIAASGGTCGPPEESAFQHPYFFYWMNRTGHSVCIDAISTDTLRALGRQGVRYFAVENGVEKYRPGLVDSLRANFRSVSMCPLAELLELPNE